jgi:hypothetical protein
MSGGRNTTPVVVREYMSESEPCAEAISLLLSWNQGRKRAAHPAAPNDARKDKDARTYPHFT